MMKISRSGPLPNSGACFQIEKFAIAVGMKTPTVGDRRKASHQNFAPV
jgi:hypothetical protein